MPFGPRPPPTHVTPRPPTPPHAGCHRQARASPPGRARSASSGSRCGPGAGAQDEGRGSFVGAGREQRTGRAAGVAGPLCVCVCECVFFGPATRGGRLASARPAASDGPLEEGVARCWASQSGPARPLRAPTASLSFCRTLLSLSLSLVPFLFLSLSLSSPLTFPPSLSLSPSSLPLSP